MKHVFNVNMIKYFDDLIEIMLTNIYLKGMIFVGPNNDGVDILRM